MNLESIQTTEHYSTCRKNEVALTMAADVARYSINRDTGKDMDAVSSIREES